MESRMRKQLDLSEISVKDDSLYPPTEAEAFYRVHPVEPFEPLLSSGVLVSPKPRFKWATYLPKQTAVNPDHVASYVELEVDPSRKHRLTGPIRTLITQVQNRGGWIVGSFARDIFMGSKLPVGDYPADIDIFCLNEASFHSVCGYLYKGCKAVETTYAVSFDRKDISDKPIQVLKGFEGKTVYDLLNGICSPLSRVVLKSIHKGIVAVVDQLAIQDINERICRISNCTNVAGVLTYLIKYSKKGYRVKWEEVQKALGLFMYMEKDEQIRELSAYGFCKIPWLEEMG